MKVKQQKSHRIKLLNKLQFAKLLNKIQKFVWKLENTNNDNIETNGELHFVKEVCNDYQNKPFVLFDIGANKGEYTDLLLHEFQNKNNYKLHLFEPQQTCVTSLKKKYQKNEKIFINEFGLSDSDETAFIYKNYDQSGLASLYKRNLNYYQLELNQTESITLKTGKEYVEKNNIDRINLLKIDVEGHELSTFSGFGEFLNADNIDYIQFEYGGANLDSHTTLLELHDMLTERGFVVCKMMRTCLKAYTYQPRLENFTYQNWVAVSPRVLKQTR